MPTPPAADLEGSEATVISVAEITNEGAAVGAEINVTPSDVVEVAFIDVDSEETTAVDAIRRGTGANEVGVRIVDEDADIWAEVKVYANAEADG